MSIRPHTVVPVCNRISDVDNLLDSIAKTFFMEIIPLTIYIEHGAPKEVKEIANTFKNPKLDVSVAQHKERKGLRDQILWCGDLVNGSEGDNSDSSQSCNLP